MKQIERLGERAGTVLHDLQRNGVAVLADAIDLETVTAARRQLDDVARAERAAGIALLEDGRYRSGVNQRVIGLLGKGEVFGRLVTAPGVLDIVRQFLGDDVLLSSITANVANPGGLPMQLHFDQCYVPPDTRYAVLANAIWPLVEFTAANGATVFVPGSHRDGRATDAVAIEAPPGSAILFDGRTVHGTGANTTTAGRPAIIVTYCLPWVRPFANHLLDLAPATFATMDRQLRDLLGCRRWYIHGQSELAYERRLDYAATTDRRR
jgi:ectoine hydroxylase-related dioxygenase (phytanoyl-CoA dioxygenase family)